MKLKTLFLSTACSALPVLALAAPPSSTTVAPGKPAEGTFHRIELAAGPGKALPYTIEVPMGWEARQVAGAPGLWIGPSDAKPPEDPRLIWVRGTMVSLAEPDKLAATIRANDAAGGERGEIGSRPCPSTPTRGGGHPWGLGCSWPPAPTWSAT
jgi:hypothetical protein